MKTFFIVFAVSNRSQSDVRIVSSLPFMEDDRRKVFAQAEFFCTLFLTVTFKVCKKPVRKKMLPQVACC